MRSLSAPYRQEWMKKWTKTDFPRIVDSPSVPYIYIAIEAWERVMRRDGGRAKLWCIGLFLHVRLPGCSDMSPESLSWAYDNETTLPLRRRQAGTHLSLWTTSPLITEVGSIRTNKGKKKTYIKRKAVDINNRKRKPHQAYNAWVYSARVWASEPDKRGR